MLGRFRFTPFWGLTRWGFIRDAYRLNLGCDEFHNKSIYTVLPLVGSFCLFYQPGYDTTGEPHPSSKTEGEWEGILVEPCSICREQAGTKSMSLEVLLEHWAPGSKPQPWTWDDEEAELLSFVCACCGRPGHYQLQLEGYIAEYGLTQGVYLGPDGRVWDGHHRIVAARRLGLETVPLEEGSSF